MAAIPALYEHCRAVFEEMRKEASVQNYGEGTSGLVYEGHLTKLVSRVGLSAPYYTKVTRMLIGMGCAEQVRRGGGAAASRWALLQEPTPELFEAASEAQELTGPPKKRTVPQGVVEGPPAQVQAIIEEQRYQDVNRRLSLVEDTLDQVLEAMAEKEAS